MAHITFIHGISNKPEQEKLRKIWVRALAQDQNGNTLDLGTHGVSSTMVYWADVLYEKPVEATAPDLAFESAGALEGGDNVFENNAAVAIHEGADPDMAWREALSGKEKKLVDSMAAKLTFDLLVNDEFAPTLSEIDRRLERIPLPWFVKRRLMKVLLRDTHHYLFNFSHSPRPGETFQVQEEIRRRMIAALQEGAAKTAPHIVVSHSMGTVIAYDCLRRVPDCPPIDGLITIGSPLGLDEIQDMLKPEWSREDGYPAKLRGPWVNVYDTLDPVTGFDGNIANDYKKAGREEIEVINEQNDGLWRHSITKYLAKPKLRAAIAKQLGVKQKP